MKYLTLLLSVFVVTISTPALADKISHVGVNGLVCDFCARAIEKTFGREDGVLDVDVNLDKKLITLIFADDKVMSDEKITNLVEDAGYNVESIHHVEE